ncbi:methylated-DNA--[protein]-cysteine S-methyltransferase [Macrococcoides caseolyticum]|uniref:methylated-DNA--[protein]-cysteine S-methyltransferase n=1 Tax=Macrococcoides caseolyticum TaxID=69966 RepID=UPI001F373D52|nr:methylated-DNA--[protein]-cysteine S-methyltransferase [Macrococcus caseolyticus]MCE4955971.1 methylated-DNA--[protein]-cysteine S-methyltransferase [Macrococcus caseolyticus]
MNLFISQFVINERAYVIASSERGVVYFGNDETTEYVDHHINRFIPLAKRITGYPADDQNSDYINDIKRYFDGELKVFNWPLDLHGTDFQKSIWNALLKIPFGESRSYSDISEMINNPKAIRAVGGAIGANPVMIVVPCHRVIGKSGKLTGFRGGLDMKIELLVIEGIQYVN